MHKHVHPYQLSPKASTFLLLSTKIFPKGLLKGIEAGENAADINYFLLLLLPSNVGNELRPTLPFYAIPQFRHYNAPFLLAAILLSTFISIRYYIFGTADAAY